MDEVQKKQSLKKRLPTVIFAIILVVGIGLLAYPTVSNWWNSFHASQAISSYSEAVEAMSPEQISAMMQEAQEYNKELTGTSQSLGDPDVAGFDYDQVLNVSGTGMMGYLQVPAIGVRLPIYHSTSEGVLQVGCGHLEGTSMPIGGSSTHSVITGHRGLPSAVLLSDLDRLQEGDLFMLNVLNSTFTYEVDQIRIVEPDQTDDLLIEPNQDLCTLLTCTPYGINSHRLLVRGHRVENVDGSGMSAEVEQISPLVVAAAVGIPVLFVILLIAMIRTRNINTGRSSAKNTGKQDSINKANKQE